MSNPAILEALLKDKLCLIFSSKNLYVEGRKLKFNLNQEVKKKKGKVVREKSPLGAGFKFPHGSLSQQLCLLDVKVVCQCALCRCFFTKLS